MGQTFTVGWAVSARILEIPRSGRFRIADEFIAFAPLSRSFYSQRAPPGYFGFLSKGFQSLHKRVKAFALNIAINAKAEARATGAGE